MRDLICIVCPRGCHLHIDDKNNVSGNSCKRGPIYAINEITNPTRMVTSTVRIIDGEICRLPVVTSNPIPKDKIFDVMNEINKVVVSAPVHIKDVIIKNVLGLNSDIIATREVDKK